MADMQLYPSFYSLFGAEPMMRGKTDSSLYLKLSPDEFKEVMNILWEIERFKNFGDTVDDLIRSNFAMIAIGMMLLIFIIGLNSGEFLSDDFIMFLAVIALTGLYLEPKYTIITK